MGIVDCNLEEGLVVDCKLAALEVELPVDCN